jgi:monosaccharide-transporting ATPase
MVAIARALNTESRVLILDEPTSSLDEAEVQTLFGVLRRLREEGMAILFVTHFLEQTYAISDRITVMRNGEREGEYACADLSRLALVNKMIGAAADSGELAQAEEAPTRHEAGAVFLAARGIARKGVLSPVDLEVRRGELLGLAGLLGSGRTERRACCSAPTRRTGQHRSRRKAAQLRESARRHSPGHRLLLGRPQARRRDPAAVGARERGAGAAGAPGYLARDPDEAPAAAGRDYVKWLGIKTASIETPIGTLSGGNQQKVLAGALAGDRSRPPDPRRTDARHRRARQAGNHGLREQLVPQGHVHPVHFVRAAGSAARVRPHGRHARPQGLRRVPPRRAR